MSILKPIEELAVDETVVLIGACGNCNARTSTRLRAKIIDGKKVLMNDLPRILDRCSNCGVKLR